MNRHKTIGGKMESHDKEISKESNGNFRTTKIMNPLDGRRGTEETEEIVNQNIEQQKLTNLKQQRETEWKRTEPKRPVGIKQKSNIQGVSGCLSLLRI